MSFAVRNILDFKSSKELAILKTAPVAFKTANF